MSQQEKIRLLVEIVGGVAVFASILLLVLEIRQNTTATKAATVHELYRDFSDRYEPPTHIIEIRNKKESGDSLTAAEIQAERTFAVSILRMFENQWYQNQVGVLDNEMFTSYANNLAPIFNTNLNGELYIDVFNNMKAGDALHPGFVEFAEEFRSASR